MTGAGLCCSRVLSGTAGGLASAKLHPTNSSPPESSLQSLWAFLSSYLSPPISTFLAASASSWNDCSPSCR